MEEMIVRSRTMDRAVEGIVNKAKIVVVSVVESAEAMMRKTCSRGMVNT